MLSPTCQCGKWPHRMKSLSLTSVLSSFMEVPPDDGRDSGLAQIATRDRSVSPTGIQQRDRSVSPTGTQRRETLLSRLPEPNGARQECLAYLLRATSQPCSTSRASTS